MNYDEAFKQSLAYFDGDDMAAEVFLTKYALTDENGELLEATPEDMHRRLAREFARIEARYPNPMTEEEIFGYMDRFKYIVPQGSPMAGVGNQYQTMSLSNCFVIAAPHDSYSGIMTTDQEQAQLMKRRGGVGFDISRLRPKGMPTNNAAKTTDGIGIFMDRFSNTTREVAQGGRRGALMLTVSVHHPEIETFINIKNDRKRVTGANISIRLSDDFMNAVKNEEKYQLRWPIDAENPVVTDWADATEIWDKIIGSAHESAEPGLLFWDTIKNRSATDDYEQFQTVSTNPCLDAATLIATADGRGAVSIKQLADEGKDVPVYSVNPIDGMVSIKMGRNPRITGYDKELVRVTLDDGSHYDTTPNHKFMLRDGTPIEAKDLKKGDSLSRFDKTASPATKGGQLYHVLHRNTRDYGDQRVFEHRLISQFNGPVEWEALKDQAKEHGFTKTGGIVVHHKDFNGLNNSPDNLEVMTWAEHQALHAALADVSGEKNPGFSGFSAEDIQLHAITLTSRLNRRFSNNDWQQYADENGLPKSFSAFRREEGLATTTALAKWAALECGFEDTETDPRLIKTLASMIEQGYDARIDNKQVLVKKICEGCGQFFEKEHCHREVSFCSHGCHLRIHNQNEKLHAARIAKTTATYAERSIKVREDQTRIYSQLAFDLGRSPMLKEWEAACKSEGVSYRLKSKNAFQNFKELQDAGAAYNHKVVSVEALDGLHTVYNITVDDNHTFAIVSPKTGNSYGIQYIGLSGVNTPNCGEITLSEYDSCRLLLVNTLSFVVEPFTEMAEFDWDGFYTLCKKAQRLMDDMVDLELEQIDKILAKIEADPEPDHVKRIERELWEKIRWSCENGRRTGLGVTAVGDTIAALGDRYGDESSIRTIKGIYASLSTAAYEESMYLASQRGAFPAWDYETEKDNEFINQVWTNMPNGYRDNWAETGRRNIACVTTAPAGSVSILTQTTSGIEPVFQTAYTRRKKINPSDKNARVDFVDNLGDQWQEFKVYHKGLDQWMKATGKTDPKESPYHGATANDIDWTQRVKVQAAAQKWVDHAISSTVNLPEDVSVDRVKEIYMAGWESGCKGLTIYREGSRSGVLVNPDPSPTTIEIPTNNAPKRPAELTCDVHHMTVLGQKWLMLVGLLNGKPYELMGGLSKFVSVPKRVRTGKIVKHNGAVTPARYDLHYDFQDPDDETIIRDINNAFENATYAAFTRTISLALRHGAPVRFVVEQIQKGSEKEDELFSFAKAASRVMKQYIADGVEISGKVCNNCGSNNLIYEEGCAKCTACGNSKCG